METLSIVNVDIPVEMKIFSRTVCTWKSSWKRSWYFLILHCTQLTIITHKRFITQSYIMIWLIILHLFSFSNHSMMYWYKKKHLWSLSYSPLINLNSNDLTDASKPHNNNLDPVQGLSYLIVRLILLKHNIGESIPVKGNRFPLGGLRSQDFYGRNNSHDANPYAQIPLQCRQDENTESSPSLASCCVNLVLWK